MFWLRPLLIATILVFCGSCKPQSDVGSIETGYFDLDSLIKQQVEKLSNQQVAVIKEVQLEGELEKDTIWLDTSGWKKELVIFGEANINRPAFNGSYATMKGAQDRFSNLLFDEYKAKDSSTLFVQNMKVYYLGNPVNLKKVTLRTSESNPLFESQRNLELRFEDLSGEPMLQSYLITGFQKLLTRDSMRYTVTTSLRFGLSKPK